MTRHMYRRIELVLEDHEEEGLKEWLFAALQSYAELHYPADPSVDTNEALTALAMVTAAAVTAENEDDPVAIKRELEAFLTKLNASIVLCMEPDAFTPEGRPN